MYLSLGFFKIYCPYCDSENFTGNDMQEVFQSELRLFKCNECGKYFKTKFVIELETWELTEEEQEDFARIDRLREFHEMLIKTGQLFLWTDKQLKEVC